MSGTIKFFDGKQKISFYYPELPQVFAKTLGNLLEDELLDHYPCECNTDNVAGSVIQRINDIYVVISYDWTTSEFFVYNIGTQKTEQLNSSESLRDGQLLEYYQDKRIVLIGKMIIHASKDVLIRELSESVDLIKKFE